MEITLSQFLLAVKEMNKAERSARHLHPMARQQMFTTLKELIEGRITLAMQNVAIKWK